MADLVTLTIDGKQVRVPAGTLVINAAKSVGIEIPAFCYYEGLSLQAACRMCLVEVEKAPKLLTACTLPAAEGMVVHTDSELVQQARKSMLELLLTNHPLDCPVCDKGGECELQDLTFRYGPGESRFLEIRHHVPEKQWSPVVYFDAPRCILCYRCVRICNEGLGVAALGVVNRGVVSEIAPNRGDHLECDECGACIDICPVGALTSGTYRYHTRPWEMKHTGTACAFCSNGCKTTLGVRNGEIIRGNNRDRSGVNGEFLCVKGRYAFDFYKHPERLRSPLMRVDGKLEEVSWARALAAVAGKFAEVKERGGRFGVIGSNFTTNEENFYLQKFVRQGLGTNNIDHHRTGDVPALMAALSGRRNVLATVQRLYEVPAALVIGSDLAQQHPLLAFQLRANWRHHGLRLYTITEGPVRERQYAVRSVITAPGREMAALEELRQELSREPELVILFGDCVKGEGVRRLIEWGDSLGIPVQYVCLVDYANSRGAADMGLFPHLGPGYRPVESPGLALPDMLADPDLDVLWVIGANPLKDKSLASPHAFVVVQELFLTETAQRADVILPAASAYEKRGHFTNVTGEVQTLSPAASVMGVKTDLEIFGLLARQMGLNLGAAKVDEVRNEIRNSVGWDRRDPPEDAVTADGRPELVRSARNTLFTSGSLGRQSALLTSLREHPGELFKA